MSDEYERYKELRLRLVQIDEIAPDLNNNQIARDLLDEERKETQDELYLLSTHLNDVELALITSHPTAVH